MGAMGGTWIALTYAVLPAALLQPLMITAGCLAGAFWGLIPAVLRTHWRVNEIITSLMCNYIAILWVDFLVYGPWSRFRGVWLPVRASLASAALYIRSGESCAPRAASCWGYWPPPGWPCC